MKNPRPNPIELLQAAQQAGAQTAERIRALQAERVTKLVDAEGEYLSEVAKIDREIATLLASGAIHSDRAAALEVRRRELSVAAREQQKSAALADFEKRIADCATAAAPRIETAVAEISAALAVYEAAHRALFADWPSALLGPTRRYWTSNVSTPRAQLMEIVQRLKPLADSDITFAKSLAATIRTSPLPELPREEIAA